MVLGATNRPADIDAAILRRMPKRFSVGLPDFLQRKKILDLVRTQHNDKQPADIYTKMLKETKLQENFPLEVLAERTEGLSGSDLKELCRNAAMTPIRENMKKADGDHAILSKMHDDVRLHACFH
jgi:SpoVK/Ycf46/Vps4 family AAA+-type ATPase